MFTFLEILIDLIMDIPRNKNQWPLRRLQIQKCRFFGGRGRSLGKAQRFPASRGDLAQVQELLAIVGVRSTTQIQKYRRSQLVKRCLLNSAFFGITFVFTLYSYVHCMYIHWRKPYQVYMQVILFEIDCASFYTNLHELFCQFIS